LFGNGSVNILNSGVSKTLPFPDATLGAFSYLLDAVAGLIGSRRRWRTMLWIVRPIAASLGIIAASEVNRGLRWAILPLGLWQVVARGSSGSTSRRRSTRP
jgi:hypothetical protein